MAKSRLDIAYIVRKTEECRAPIVGNVLAVTTSTSSAATQVPSQFMDQASFWVADGADIYILFGTSGVVADRNATSGSYQCIKLSGGVPTKLFLESYDSITHFAAQASAGTPTLRAWVSSH